MSAWLQQLKARLFPTAPAVQVDDSEDQPAFGEQGKAHAGDEPGALHHGKRRLKEYYTNHWDMDYLPRDEVDELFRKNREQSGRH